MSKPTPISKPIMILEPIPEMILIAEPIPEPILEPIPETDFWPTIWNRFQETSELYETDSDKKFVFPITSRVGCLYSGVRYTTIFWMFPFFCRCKCFSIDGASASTRWTPGLCRSQWSRERKRTLHTRTTTITSCRTSITRYSTSSSCSNSASTWLCATSRTGANRWYLAPTIPTHSSYNTDRWTTTVHRWEATNRIVAFFTVSVWKRRTLNNGRRHISRSSITSSSYT